MHANLHKKSVSHTNTQDSQQVDPVIILGHDLVYYRYEFINENI